MYLSAAASRSRRARRTPTGNLHAECVFRVTVTPKAKVKSKEPFRQEQSSKGDEEQHAWNQVKSRVGDDAELKHESIMGTNGEGASGSGRKAELRQCSAELLR